MACKYVPVPKEDTYALIARAQAGDEEAKALIVEQNTGLVKKIALKFVTADSELEDLIQIGYMGLLKAVNKFEPEYDVMFSTYAVPMIMGEIRRYFRDNGKIKASRSLKTEIYTLKKVQDELTEADGRKSRISEIAKAMDLSCERVLEIMEAQEKLSNVASLDNRLVEEEYEQYYVEGSPESRLDSMMMKAELVNLKARERQVIVLRYFRDMTQQEIAKILNISQVQVSRIEKRAIAQMRKKMEE